MAKSIVSPKSKSTRANKKPAAAVEQTLELNHAQVFEPDAGDLALSQLIAELNGDVFVESDEIIEVPHSLSDMVDDSILESAISSAEAAEAMLEDATPEGVFASGAVPTGNTSDVVKVERESSKTLEAALEAALEDDIKAGIAPAPVAPAEPKAVAKRVKKPAEDSEKKPAVPRKHYTDKTERLKDKLGTQLGEYTVLTMADAAVPESELQAKMDDTLIIIKGLNKKAQIWAVKFVEFLGGKKSSISEVTGRCIKLLQRDGYISMGSTGNLYLDLVSKPYSPGAARAMGGNNIAMLQGLKLIEADGKGRFVPNPDSLLLMKAVSMMGGAVPAPVMSATPVSLASPEDKKVKKVVVAAPEPDSELEELLAAEVSEQTIEDKKVYEDALM